MKEKLWSHARVKIVMLSFTVSLLCYMLAVDAAQAQQLDGSLELENTVANVQITAQK